MRLIPPPAHRRHPAHPPLAILIPGSRLALLVPEGCGLGLAMRLAYWGRHRAWVRHRHEIAHLVLSDSTGLAVPVDALDEHETRTGSLQRVGVWRDPVERMAAVHGMYAVRQQPDHQLWFAGVPGVDLGRFVDYAQLELGKVDPSSQHPSIRRQVDTLALGRPDEVVASRDLPAALGRHGVRVPPGSRAVRHPRRIVPEEIAHRIRQLYAADLAYGERVRTPRRRSTNP